MEKKCDHTSAACFGRPRQRRRRGSRWRSCTLAVGRRLESGPREGAAPGRQQDVRPRRTPVALLPPLADPSAGRYLLQQQGRHGWINVLHSQKMERPLVPRSGGCTVGDRRAQSAPEPLISWNSLMQLFHGRLYRQTRGLRHHSEGLTDLRLHSMSVKLHSFRGRLRLKGCRGEGTQADCRLLRENLSSKTPRSPKLSKV